MRAFFLFLATLSAPAAAADSPISRAKIEVNPFPGVCDGKIFVKQQSYQTDKAYWDVALKCDPHLQVLPDTGFWETIQGKLGEQSDEDAAAAFLDKFRQSTLDHLEFNNAMSEIWMNCAQLADKQKGAQEWFDQKAAAAKKTGSDALVDLYDSGKCDARLADLKKLIKDDGTIFREAREVMNRTGAGVTSALNKAVNGGIKAVNWSLPLGLEETVLPGESVPLTETEKTEVDIKLRTLEKQFRATLPIEGKKAVQRLIAFRQANPNLPLEAIEPPVDHWMIDYYKAGGGQGHDDDTDNAPQILQDAAHSRMLGQAFQDAYPAYAKALGEAPVLAFLTTPNPSNADIAKAAAEVLKRGQKDQQSVAGIKMPKGTPVVQGTIPARSIDRVNALKELLNRGPLLREWLKANPDDCAIAAALHNYVQNKKDRNSAYLALGSIAAGFAGGALVSGVAEAAGVTLEGATVASAATAVNFGVGTMFGGARVYSTYQDFVKAKNQAFGVVHTSDNVDLAGTASISPEDYAQARQSFVMSTAEFTAGLALAGGTRAAVKYFASSDSLESQVVIQKLMQSGKTENEAKQIVRDLASATPATANAARTAVADVMNVSPREVEVFGKMIQKQLLDPKNASELLPYSQRLAQMAPAERELMLQRMNSVIDQVNSVGAKVNRADAMRLVVAASEAGPYDATAVAARAAAVANNLKTWDKGIYGLARTYDQAKANLSSPEIEALPEPQRYSAAYDKALQQFGVKDPLVRVKMLRCGGVSVAK